MKRHVTSGAAAFRHPEFVLAYDENAVQPADVALVEKRLMLGVRAGGKHAAGDLVGLGVMTGRLSEEDGLLVVNEPDMTSFPICFVPGVTRIAQFFARQKPVIDSLERPPGLVPDYPSIMDSTLACTRWEQGLGVLDRGAKGPRDTGWFAGCRDPSHDHNNPDELVRISTYELVRRHPDCIRWLPLWVGCNVELKATPCITADRKLGLKLKPDSALAREGVTWVTA